MCTFYLSIPYKIKNIDEEFEINIPQINHLTLVHGIGNTESNKQYMVRNLIKAKVVCIMT